MGANAMMRTAFAVRAVRAVTVATAANLHTAAKWTNVKSTGVIDAMNMMAFGVGMMKKETVLLGDTRDSRWVP